MTKTARSMLWIVLLLIIVGVLSGLYMSVKRHYEQRVEEKAAVPVRVVTAEARPLIEEFRYTGTILAEPTADVGAKVAGTIAEVLVREGDHVEEGDVLATIDDAVYADSVSLAAHQVEAARAQLASAQSARPESIAQARAALAAAESALNTARNNYERQKTLFDEGVISEAQLELAETQYEGAKATYRSAAENLKMAESGARPEDKKTLEMALKLAQDQLALAQKNLAYTRIRAPFSAAVTSKMIDVGEYAAPGVPLFKLSNLDGMELQIFLPSELASQIEVGTAASYVSPVDGSIRSATVSRIFPASTEESRQVEARLKVPAEAAVGLRPGDFVDVTMIRELSRGHIVIPLSAIIAPSTEHPRIFILEGATAREVEVRIGSMTGRDAEILSPLSGGEQVVVSGQNYLSDGATVRIVEPEAAGGSL